MNTSFLRFDDFEPGALLGSVTDMLEERLLADWQRLYPWETAVAGEAPASLAVALVMRAYLRVVAARPPGNVHAAQRLLLHAPPRTGERITTQVWCDSTEIRAYAKLTGDLNPIHLDPVFAAGTAAGGIIAHGTFSLNLIVQSLSATLGEASLRGLDLDVRFIRPVRPGDRLTVGGEAVAGNSWAVRVLNQRGEAGIEGTALLPP